MNLADITPIILTWNEAPNVRRCLEKLAWAHEAVVLDSLSTDGTQEAARACRNVHVVERPFDTYASQWNHGVSLVTTPWILSLDADYILPEGFVSELERLDPSQETVAYYAGFHYCIFGKPLRNSLYPPRPVLFRRDRCTHFEDGHAQRLRMDGSFGKLDSVIAHDDRKPLSRWLGSQARYAELEAKHLLTTPRAQLNRADRMRRWIFAAPVLVFFYTLFGKGLILDGPAGWYYVMQRTLAELVLSLQLMHRKLEGTSGDR